MREMQNRPAVRPAYILTPQPSCPIPLGFAGRWFDSNTGLIKDRATNGTDTVVAGSAGGASLVADVVAVAALPTNTYDNGTAGVGAFLQKTTNGALPSIDGVALAVGSKILVTAEAAAARNGLYEVTSLGSGGSKWKLTRVAEFAESSSIEKGTSFPVTQGDLFSGTEWLYTGINSPIVGTTALSFSPEAAIGLKAFTNATRPAFTDVGATLDKPVVYWNIDDHATNTSDTTGWYDAVGNPT